MMYQDNLMDVLDFVLFPKLRNNGFAECVCGFLVLSLLKNNSVLNLSSKKGKIIRFVQVDNVYMHV